jgi:rhodanese-related sulfurtransferase
MPVTTDVLARLEPISALSAGRLQELGEMCSIERVSQGLNPFRMNVVQSEQLLYLLSGQLQLAYVDGRTEMIDGGSDASCHALVADQAELQEALALTEVQILRIDADLLDIMLTWDQLAGYEKSRQDSQSQAGKWMQTTGVFSAESLKNGIFRTLPPANVDELFRRMEKLPVEADQVVILQGQPGDYYYLIEAGTAEVTRAEADGSTVSLAMLSPGQAFGEEALASGNDRNATVTMRSSGTLLRLGKKDFEELLKTPLLKEIKKDEAERRVRGGAKLVDVRTAAEYRFKHLPGAISLPLHGIREAMKTLNKNDEYVVYCQTGRRAVAATFILAQQGFNASALTPCPTPTQSSSPAVPAPGSGPYPAH